RSLVRGVERALQRPRAASQYREFLDGVGVQARNGRLLDEANFVGPRRSVCGGDLYAKEYAERFRIENRTQCEQPVASIAINECGRPLVAKNATGGKCPYPEAAGGSQRPGQAGAEVQMRVLRARRDFVTARQAEVAHLTPVVLPVHAQENVRIERRVRAAFCEREPPASALRLGDFPPGAHESEIVRRLEADSRRAVITLEAREI